MAILETNNRLLRQCMKCEGSVRLAEILIGHMDNLLSSSDLPTFWTHPMLRALIIFLSADSDVNIDIAELRQCSFK
jgi:hypothetical protein